MKEERIEGWKHRRIKGRTEGRRKEARLEVGRMERWKGERKEGK